MASRPPPELIPPHLQFQVPGFQFPVPLSQIHPGILVIKGLNLRPVEKGEVIPEPDFPLEISGKVVVFPVHDSVVVVDRVNPVGGRVSSLRAGHGIALPGADLLLTNTYEVLAADILEAKHIGRGVIDGRECEHLAFRNFDTDWQLWVEMGERPIPRKMVITSKTLNSAPQYTLRVKEWNTDVQPAADAFMFIPPAGAEKLGPEMLIDLDELPPDTPAGGEQ